MTPEKVANDILYAACLIKRTEGLQKNQDFWNDVDRILKQKVADVIETKDTP